MPEKSEDGNQEVRQRKPANTAFKQQRLRAWQPILTPRVVLPTFFILGLIFIPLGIGLYMVQELVFDYTDCTSASSTMTPVTNGPIVSWSFDPSSNICKIRFQVQSKFTAPVFLYYRLSNFYQNHRRYVKSLSNGQLKGQALSASSLSSDCDPLVTAPNGKIYYPCGLIANSWFNDTIGELSSSFTSFSMKFLDNNNNPQSSYSFSEKEISWPSDMEKYEKTSYNLNDIVPPKDWYGRVINGLTINGSWNVGSDIVFNPKENEHFQVWMRTAGLPTFRKLYGKNTDIDLQPGIYELQIVYNFPVKGFSGTKSIVLSTTSWLGGKNPFLGIAYMTVGSICIFLGIVFLIKHQLSPRKLGDHTYLSWNQNNTPNPGQRQ